MDAGSSAAAGRVATAGPAARTHGRPVAARAWLRGRALAVAVALAGAAASALVHADTARAAASWRLEQPPPPAGVPFKVPLGKPGDLSCWSANRCLLAVEGNATIPRGLFAYDGVAWHQLSTVCGGPADSTRIAWAGPDDFWTITEPSPPRLGGGLGLCHFVGGAVVGSFSTADQSPDPFRPMDAAACLSPTDCWFAGVGSSDPSGQRVGAYHLHWDGQSLTSTYAPQGRGVSDLVADPAAGLYYETTLVGVQREDGATPVTLAQPEVAPQTIHTIAGQTFADAPYAAIPPPGVPLDGSELLAADLAPGNTPWFVGGGAASGPDAPDGGSVARPPIAVRYADGFYRELALDAGLFGSNDRFTDVAAVPGSSDAWATVQSFAERDSTTARARVAHLLPDGSASVQELPAAGAGRGAAAVVAFTSPTDGWMVTNAGWVFHYTDGTPLAQDTDPAFQQLIAFRPNESVAQAIPDAPPADDSQLFAPPPPPPPATPPKAKVRTRRIPALMARLSKPRVDGRLRLSIAFTLRRPARVELLAKRHGRVVSHSRLVRLRPGRHTLTIQLARSRWPDALAFRTVEAKR
jgi:hypothetical protein